MATLTGINSRGLKKGDAEPPLASGRPRLYINRFCPWSERVLLYAAAKGIDVEIVNIDPLNKPEWYFSKHPQGKVPAFEKDGKVIIESAVIPEYLDAIYPSTAILPTDPYLRAKQRMSLEGASDITTTFHFLVLIFNGTITEDEKVAKVKEVEEALDAAEDAFYGNDYFGGASPGYADWMLFPIINRVALFSSLLSLSTPFPSARWPGLSAWFNRLSAHPAVTAVAQSAETYRAFAESYAAGKPDFDFGI